MQRDDGRSPAQDISNKSVLMLCLSMIVLADGYRSIAIIPLTGDLVPEGGQPQAPKLGLDGRLVTRPGCPCESRTVRQTVLLPIGVGKE